MNRVVLGLRKFASVAVNQITRRNHTLVFRPRSRLHIDPPNIFPPPVYRARLNYTHLMDVAFNDSSAKNEKRSPDFHAHVLTLMKDLNTYNTKHLANGTSKSSLSNSTQWNRKQVSVPDVCAPKNEPSTKKADAMVPCAKNAASSVAKTLETGLVSKPDNSSDKGPVEIPRPNEFKNIINPIIKAETSRKPVEDPKPDKRFKSNSLPIINVSKHQKPIENPDKKK